VSARTSSPASRIMRAIFALAAIGAAVYAIQGGEWSTVDLVRQTSHLARLHHDVDSLNHDVDSLKKYKQAVLTDPVAQEKIAREEFGMVRGNKEILYRFTEPDTASGKANGGSRKP
jgi:cell division protein FtsB